MFLTISMANKLKKQIKKNLGYKKWLRKKENNMSSREDMIIIMAGLIKKIQYKWVNTSLNHTNLLGELLILELIYLMIKQKQI